MPLVCRNNLLVRKAGNSVCTALGIKLIPSPITIQIAKTSGYDSVFIDLEHSTLSLEQAGALCTTALCLGVTPFVRVPHQCGDGFVQRVLDGGAMGVIVPHIRNAEDAAAAVRICKYPPVGKRSMTALLPQFGYSPTPGPEMVGESNDSASTVLLMIETQESLDNIDEIAAVPGVDVLLVGSNDLAVELGVQGQWDGHIFQDALTKVSRAASKHGTVFGLAGLYNRKDILEHVVNSLGARYLLGNLDAGLLVNAARDNATLLKSVQK